jgi:hypothetical protein
MLLTMLDLQRKSSTEVPVSWKGMEAGKEWRGTGAVTPWASWTSALSPKAEKVETFFFSGLIDYLVVVSLCVWRSQLEMDFDRLNLTDFTSLFDCVLPPHRSSGMKGGDTVTNLGLGRCDCAP